MVPPEGLAVRVTDWPESIVGDAGEIEPAVGEEFTVTVSPTEQAVGAGVPVEESVTW